MKTNNALIKEIESGKNPLDVLAQEKREIRSEVDGEDVLKDAYYIGALEAKFIIALEAIIKLRKENTRLENQYHDLYAESKREDLEQEATYENVVINEEKEAA